MISNLKLNNFKAFESLEVKFRPLTFILGPNNSGKSSVIAPFPLLIQTIESFDNSVALLLDGVMGDFGTYKDLVFGNNRRRQITICIEFDRVGRPNEIIGIELDFKYRTRRKELILKAMELSKNGNSLLKLEASDDSERLLLSKIGGKSVPAQLRSSTSRYGQLHHFLPSMIFFLSQSGISKIIDQIVNDEKMNSDEWFDQIRREMNRASNLVRRSFTEMDYIGALRVPPSRTYLFTGERRQRVGAAGENAASLIVLDSARSKSSGKKLIELVSQWLNDAGIAEEVKVVPISDRHYEIRIVHPVTGENQNIKDVGYGNSQVIPVLIGGYNLPKGATYLVEEPEIHLHPRAQAELGNFFFELYERGVQSIVETHSEYLILRLQQLVADKKIAAKDIVFYYVEAGKNLRKTITQLELDEDGKFISEMPHGFFPERLQEAKRLSQIRFKHLKKES